MAAAFPPGTVLVLKPSSLGDVVHTLPAVARLRAVRPGWRVAWLVNPEWVPLLRGNPLGIETIVEFPRREFRGPAGWGRLGRWLRAEIVGSRPGLALDFQGLLRTALLGRLAGAGRLQGLSDAREGATLFYHRTTPTPPGPVHAVRRYLALVDDVLAGAGQDLPVTFPLPPGEPWPEPAATGGDGFIVLHPFARGAGKSLTAGQVRALCEGLAPRRTLVVGSGGEPIGDLPGHAENLLGRTTLRQLLDLLRRAAFVLSVDSGPMHLAAAALVEPRRLLSLHAWSDPRRVGPFPPTAFVWQSGLLRQVGELPADGSPPPVPGPLLPGVDDVRAVCAHVIRESGL